MSDDDPLVSLRHQLADLEEAPLSSHPEVLERVHRALVDELEGLEHLEAPEAPEAPEAAGQPGDADQPPAAGDGAAGSPPHDGDEPDGAGGEGGADR